MTEILPPAPRPCDSCPYRRDVPSGVWSAAEYERLPPFDKPTYEQPVGVFMCHQSNGRACAGWVGCHDMQQSLGLRVAGMMGMLSEATIQAILDYVSPVPLFGSGVEAAAHGLARVAEPGLDAAKAAYKVARRRGIDLTGGVGIVADTGHGHSAEMVVDVPVEGDGNAA